MSLDEELFFLGVEDDEGGECLLVSFEEDEIAHLEVLFGCFDELAIRVPLNDLEKEVV